MNELKDILIKFSEKYNLKQEALDSCSKAMANCLEDDSEGLGGFKINEIKFEFVKQDLIFEHYLYETPFIKTKIGLYKKEENDIFIQNLEPIGYYELNTNMVGESFDDLLIIDEEKNNQLEILFDLKELNQKLPEKYLRRNSLYYEYISYMAHVVTLYQASNLRACQIFIIRAFEFVVKTEINDDFQEYLGKSKKYLKRIVSYIIECGLLEEDLIEKFEQLEIIKTKG